MKLLKYSELLKLGKEKVNEMIAPLRANEMKKKAEFEICKLQSTIAEKEQEVQEALAVYPIDFENIIKKFDQVDIAKRRLEQLNKLLRDIF